MNALGRLRATRRVLGAGVLAQALLWGAVAAFVVRGAAPGLAGEAALAAAAVVALGVGWRGRRGWSLSAAALWVEQRRPALAYALVTRAEGVGDARMLEAAVARVEWGGEVRRALLRALLPPVITAAAVLVSSGALRRAAEVAGGTTGAHNGAVAAVARGAGARRLTPLRVRIVPPPYTGLAPEVLDDPDLVSAVVGSRLSLLGPGSADSVRVVAGEHTLTVAAGNGWSATLIMPREPLAVRLAAPGEARLIALAPVLDSLPMVVLDAPSADTVFRAPSGALRIAARATDDFGLAALWVEYIVSAGEGESFTFRSGVLHTVRPGGKTGTLSATLSLDSLGLKAGDLVHLRAVARDGNTVTGPGVGVSATRTLRVAREDEYDSVAVDAAAPADAEKSALSQRMLIQLAESLQRRRGKLAREVVVREAQGIARDQARLRQQVSDLIFMRLGEGDGEHSHDPDHPGHDAEEAGAVMTPEQLLAAADAATGRGMDEPTDFHGDETPVVHVNRPLLEAYNAMWSAGGELEVGEPGRALPHMRAALAAIQRSREAERLYLRGRPPAVVVDLARVRLAGSRADAAPAPRTARPAADSARAGRIARFERALRLTASSPGAALDSLLLLRVELLAGHSTAAAALGEAITRLRAGQDATDAFVLARRRLSGTPSRSAALPRWGGGR